MYNLEAWDVGMEVWRQSPHIIESRSVKCYCKVHVVCMCTIMYTRILYTYPLVYSTHTIISILNVVFCGLSTRFPCGVKIEIIIIWMCVNMHISTVCGNALAIKCQSSKRGN